MREAWWFANLCPYFSVFHLDTFFSLYGDSAVTVEKLESLNLHQAAHYLLKFEDKWNFHLCEAKKELDKGSSLLFWGDSNFPEKLKHLSWPPSVLFLRGDLEFKTPVVAIVGARNPTTIGRLWVEKVVPELTKLGIVIVSGGARGIDAEAHYAALKSGGRTWAFLPGGVENPYPLGNGYIFERMLKRGALISEFLNHIQVRPENFQRRNRLIAGIADLVVIVEAGIKSGTYMTAGLASSENRDVLVVPGPPLIASYTGSLELISQGAGLARDERDIILALEKRNALKLT